MWQVIVPKRSNGWTTAFFITDARERNILGIDNLAHFGIEVAQKTFPHYKNSFKNKSFINSVGLNRKHFQELPQNLLTESVKKLKITHCHDLLKPIKLKGRRVPLHWLPAVSKELDSLISEGHTKKLESRNEDRFISAIVTACSKDKARNGLKKFEQINIQKLIPDANHTRTCS